MAENMKAVDAQHKKDSAKLEKKLASTETTLEKERIAVSYTHLTLPTISSV